jgi:hypothetical protein
MNRARSLALFLLLAAAPATAETEGTTHRSAPVGSPGGIMNPDVSAVVNTTIFFTDDKSETDRNTLSIQEAEIAFQSYLYPGIRGDFIIAMHPEGSEWHVHPEEAVVSFLDLPLALQAQAGRRLIPFGRLNPVHPHHWAFATTPLPLAHLFGGHAWYDDGVNVDWLVPNPWGVYCKLAAGVWSGETLEGHEHGDEHAAEEEHGHAFIAWHGNAYTARANFDFPVGEMSNVVIGYSAGWDDGSRTILHGGDLTITYRRPMSYHRLRWQSEIFLVDAEGGDSPIGLYSLLAFTPDKYWELGARYDRSELFAPREEEGGATPIVNGEEWGLSAFVTRYFTHSLYLRAEYSRSLDRFDVCENRATVQLVWGLGPHAHRLEE